MSQTRDSIVKAFLHIVCLSITIIYTRKCINDYLKNEDVTQVFYRKFHEDKHSVYPSFTHCMAYPILHGSKIWGNYSSKDPKEARKDYRDFLLGQKQIKGYDRIDYDDVTSKLEWFLVRFGMKMGNTGSIKMAKEIYWFFENGDFIPKVAQNRFVDALGKSVNEDLLAEEKQHIPKINFYVSRRSIKEKCYTFDVPYISKGAFKKERVNRISLMIRPGMLPGVKYWNKKPINVTKHHKEKHFSMHFHFPNQQLRTVSKGSGFKSTMESADYYARKYYLGNIEVLRRRNKDESPCLEMDEAGPGYDERIMERTITEVGCRPPTTKVGISYPLCNATQDRQFKKKLVDDAFHPPPCASIQSMSETNEEEDQRWMLNQKHPWNQSMLIHEIYFQDNIYKEIEYMRKYTWESLIGNVGGVIGRYKQESSKHI